MSVFTGRMDGLVSHSSEEGRWEYDTHRGTIRKLPGLGSRSDDQNGDEYGWSEYWGPGQKKVAPSLGAERVLDRREVR